MSVDEKRIAAIEARLSRLEGAGRGGGGPPKDVAPDSDLDSQYGDPEIRKDPSAKYWTGDSFVGRTMSQCSVEYLDALERYKDACAFANEKEGKPEKAKYIEYDRRDARRARGWAQRKRSGAVIGRAPQQRYGTSGGVGSVKHGVPPEPANAFAEGEFTEESSDDSIPFAHTVASFTPRHLRRRSLWQKF